MRIWLGTALLLSAARRVASPGDHTLRLDAWLPLGTAAQLPASFALIGGALLLLGLGTRYVTVALVLMLSLCSLLDPRLTDAVYLLMMSAIFITYGAGKLSVDHLIGSIFESRWARTRGEAQRR